MSIYLDLLIISTVVKSKRDLLDDVIVSTMHSTIANNDSLNSSTPIPILNLSDLIRRTFLILANENGKYLRARIAKAIED